MGELGDLLRESREAKGLSLEGVEAQTKIRRRLLQALEDQDFDALPAPVFAKGFLRNYARLLELDSDHVIELYNQAVGDTDQPYDLHVLSEPLEEGPSPWPVVIAIVMLLVLLALAGWLAVQQGLVSLPAWLARGQSTVTTVALTETATHTVMPSHTLTAQPTGTHTHTAVPATPSASPSIQPSETATVEPSSTSTVRPTQTATLQPSSSTPTVIAAAPTGAAMVTVTRSATATARPSDTATRPVTATITRAAQTATATATAGNTIAATTTATLRAGDAAVLVELDYQADAWVRIYTDGIKVHEGLVAAGTKQSWAAAQQVYVHCGYGSGVLATVNGRSYGPLGPRPDTVHVEWAAAAGTPSVASAASPTQIVLATISP